MTLLTVIQYGFYLMVFSVFLALSIIIVGVTIKEVRKYWQDKPPTTKDEERK